jgi:hypothetical protein
MSRFDEEDTPERMQLELGFAEEAVALAHAFVTRKDATPRDALARLRDLISSLFLARAAQSLKSSCILSSHGAIGDAMAVTRTIVELDIEHAYIVATDIESRWERFVEFDATSVSKLVKGMSAIPGSPITATMIEHWQNQAKAAKKLAGDTRCWAGPGIDTRARALATGRHLEYDIGYRDMCAASHAGFSTFAYVTDLNARSSPIAIRLGFGPPSARALALGLASMFGLLREATSVAGAEALAERVRDLEGRYRVAYEDRKQENEQQT